MEEQPILTQANETSQQEQPTMEEMQIQLREIQKRLAAAEDEVKSLSNKVKSLEVARDKHTDDMECILPWMTELVSSDQSLREEQRKIICSLAMSRFLLRQVLRRLGEAHSRLKKRGFASRLAESSLAMLREFIYDELV
ncbi:hypothetical protein NW762_011767 [Fusarium torreyae]|uniref:Uncharacterized protein n=1 Tax=Fusarium torreyae TaxID=1237075 RepID=A0A9W8RRK6_9HYPO|nr:hypothetical protein NW762_011767 [Fusarium torreyae]